MPDSKRNTPRSSPDGTGAKDLEKVDAHAISAEDYEEIPELTDAMMACAVPGDGLELLKRGREPTSRTIRSRCALIWT